MIRERAIYLRDCTDEARPRENPDLRLMLLSRSSFFLGNQVATKMLIYDNLILIFRYNLYFHNINNMYFFHVSCNYNSVDVIEWKRRWPS